MKYIIDGSESKKTFEGDRLVYINQPISSLRTVRIRTSYWDVRPKSTTSVVRFLSVIKGRILKSRPRVSLLKRVLQPVDWILCNYKIDIYSTKSGTLELFGVPTTFLLVYFLCVLLLAYSMFPFQETCKNQGIKQVSVEYNNFISLTNKSKYDGT